MKKAFFRFEASPTIGAGHAIRSCVIADELAERGWDCKIVTKDESYKFINSLSRFTRIEPQEFILNPQKGDLLVIDNYDLDIEYEEKFRPYVNKILVIDDLANRRHDCDILVDQTYRREESDYLKLVPNACKILTGAKYVLLRPDFLKIRNKALEKRYRTKEIRKVLISFGGSDPKNYTLKALQMLESENFSGDIDIVLGFNSSNIQKIKEYIKTLPNKCQLYINPNMAELTYNADLAIGGSGSSVWERCCLGLPSVLLLVAENQKVIYRNLLQDFKLIFSDLKQALTILPNAPREFYDQLGFIREVNLLKEMDV